MKQYEALNWASLFLKQHNCEEQVSTILLQHHLNVSSTAFYMNMRESLSSHVFEDFERDIKRHVETGIPVQHLTGKEMFYGRSFKVNQHVLIPRPETEELIYHVVKKYHAQNPQPKTIVDIGTGSGIIAITLALELSTSTVYATDISSEALHTATENANNHHANITFYQGNFLEPFIEKDLKADIIVSNPPYIAKKDAPILSKTVSDFEPDIALFAEDDGLAAYKEIVRQTPKVMKDDTLLALEIGHNQGQAVCDIIKSKFPTATVEIIQDINKKDRMIFAKLI